MKFVVILFLLLVIPIASVEAQIDVESLGRPFGWDDSVNMSERYVYFDEGEITKNSPLIMPVITRDEALEFSTMAVSNALTMSFGDYKERLKQIEEYFTEDGWHEFSTMMENVQLIDTLVKNYYTLSSATKGRPILKAYGVEKGKTYIWDIDVPVMMSYTQSTSSDDKVYPFEMIVRIRIVRVPVGPSYHNVKIDKWAIRS